MYDSLTKTSGIEAVNQYLANYQVEVGPDGLSLVTGDGGSYGANVKLPERLRDFLTDIRLLRHLPLAYLVPDAALLPPESIRFFHVDPTWMDRVIDGVFAAANTGTVDFVFSYSMLQMARAAIDAELTSLAKAQVPSTSWTGDKPMTGMIIRSELARRWPDMIVRGFTSASVPDGTTVPTIAALRAETISKDIYIALFAGQPKTVHVREPNVGTRYGVEPQAAPTVAHPYKVDGRPTDGNTAPNAPAIILSFRGAPSLRILSLNGLATAAGSVEDSARQVALNLEQLPYVQKFIHNASHQEPSGSKEPESVPGGVMHFRGGRSMTMEKLKARKAQLNEMES